MEPAWVKVNGRNFALVEYKDAKGELRPCYQLTKTECLYIATKFNDEARAKLVLRWEELERADVRRIRITRCHARCDTGHVTRCQARCDMTQPLHHTVPGTL